MTADVPGTDDDGADVAPGRDGRPAAVPFRTIMQQRLARRDVLSGAARLAPLLAIPPSLLAAGGAPARAAAKSALTFRPITISGADKVVVADGHVADVLLRWGDPLFEEVPELDTATLGDPAKSELLNKADAAALQEKRFGYNCDYNGFFPLPGFASAAANQGLLATNHEYTDDALMFAGFPAFHRIPDRCAPRAGRGAGVDRPDERRDRSRPTGSARRVDRRGPPPRRALDGR